MRTDAIQQYLALHKFVYYMYSWRSQERSRLETVQCMILTTLQVNVGERGKGSAWLEALFSLTAIDAE